MNSTTTILIGLLVKGAISACDDAINMMPCVTRTSDFLYDNASGIGFSCRVKIPCICQKPFASQQLQLASPRTLLAIQTNWDPWKLKQYIKKPNQTSVALISFLPRKV